MKFRLTFSTLLLIFCNFALVGKEKPNFLLILLDDAGWTDLGCYGSQIQTPRMDQLAAEGMRFTDCHSAAPNCSPSRAGLLTGRTPTRSGIYSYLPKNHVMHLRSEEVTLAELLKKAGYHTGHFGKWHLSRLQSDQPSPADQGFDYSFGTDNNAAPNHHNPVNFIRNGALVGKQAGYSCQIVVAETVSWFDRIATDQPPKPFFACVWFHEPHTPIASPPDLVKKYQNLYPDLNRKQAAYHANVENVDRAVGRLLTYLKKSGLAEDTVVFLTSDNGPLNNFSRAGLRGQKSNLWEGGHRVPGIFRWPGNIQPGTESSVLISGVDYLPTVCDIAGIQPPSDRALDGASILPLLAGKPETFQRRQPLYWFFYRVNPSLAMRIGQWSLIAHSNDAQRPKTHPLVQDDMPPIKTSHPTAFQLFNLKNDLRQQQNLASTQPALLQELREKLSQKHAEVIREGYFWNIPEEYGASNKRRIWTSE